ncbi:MAG: hypothetical protein GY861_27125 [bacterium]|nr:hypothetical protein [bacterium]
MKIKSIVGIAFMLAWVIGLAYLVVAPPAPHNVRGFIYDINMVQMPLYTKVTINVTNSSDFVETRTWGPPFATGAYAASVVGSDADTVIVTSWNATHYGNANTTLLPTTTYLDVILNMTRSSEPNITIISLINNTVYNLTDTFNVTINVTIIGGADGLDCNATINFTNHVFSVEGDDYVHPIGNIIPLFEQNTTTWTVTADSPGVSNISLRASCASDGVILKGLNAKAIYNVTSQVNSTIPEITLESPDNNSLLTAGIITFKYYVASYFDILNCTLILNNKINISNDTVVTYTTQNFSQSLEAGQYNWSVNCTNDVLNTGASLTYNLTLVEYAPPIITEVFLEDTIDLIPGANRTIYCNATVYDGDFAGDINSTNATFFRSSVGHLAPNDNNNHYFNSSCVETGSAIYEKNFSCSFEVTYYADNASWQCYFLAEDGMNLTGYLNKTTTINQLVALDAFETYMIYSEVLSPPDNATSEDSNVSLINLGNTPINITVLGYGSVEEDELSMKCQNGGIPVGYEKYSPTNGTEFDEMQNLTALSSKMKNFTLAQRTDDNEYDQDVNSTFWKIMVPGGVGGNCSGTIIFSAVTNQ